MPDEIFRGAILTNSHYIALVHNDPSGKAKPSQEDLGAIALLRAQAKVMRKSLLDFIIVGEKTYWSVFDADAGDEYWQGGTGWLQVAINRTDLNERPCASPAIAPLQNEMSSAVGTPTLKSLVHPVEMT